MSTISKDLNYARVIDHSECSRSLSHSTASHESRVRSIVVFQTSYNNVDNIVNKFFPSIEDSLSWRGQQPKG
jgi:hypothetical protein